MKYFLALAFLFLSACNLELNGPGGSKAGTNVGNANTESYSYEMEVNGCKTGHKEFSNRTDYCNSLKDDSANNFCARDTRYDQFKADCDGHSWN